MSGWTEQRLRREASWQAFKEGRSLFERGRVGELKFGPELVTATVAVGKRRYRTVVRTGDRLEVECQCPENRRSGEVCPHGVAVALASMSSIPEVTESVNEMVEPLASGPAFRMIFPPGFERGLAAGRLALRISVTDEPVTDPDRSLGTWLRANGVAEGNPPQLLTLKGEEVSGFLEAIAGHPRIEREDGGSLQVPDSGVAPLELVDSQLVDGRVHLEVVPPTHAMPWGDSLGWIRGDEIGHAPVQSPGLGWRDEALEFIREGRLVLRLDEFLRSIDAWLDLVQSPYKGWLGELRFERRAPEVRIEIEGSLNALDLKLQTDGSSEVVLAADGHTVQTEDRERLQTVIRHLTESGFKFAGERMTLRDPDQIAQFLADGIRALQKDATVAIGSRLEHVRKSLHVIRPHYQFGEGGSLSCEISFQTDGGKVIPRAKVMDLMRRGKPSVKTRQGATVVLSRSIAEESEPLLADLGLVHPEGKLQLDRAQHECLRRLASPESEIDLPERAPATVGDAVLRDYQRHGVDWILDRWQRFNGAMLADEMGLGKTLQTIVALGELKKDDCTARALVLVPTSLLSNWELELERFAPDLAVVRLHGSARDERRDAALAADVVLTSYGTLVRDFAFHLKQTYGLLVCDEASLLRNPGSEVSKSVAKLRPERRLVLTGTPIENRLRDLWSIFRVVAPGYLGSREDFEGRYEEGDESEIHRLRARISPFMLRRTKEQVADDLPPKTEIDQWLDFDPETRRLYREVAQAGMEKWEKLDDSGDSRAAGMHLLTVLLRLRQICLDPSLIEGLEEERESAKSIHLKQLLESKLGESGKTLVFSQFRTFLQIEEKRLRDAGQEVFRLDGSTRDRGQVVQSFQSADPNAVFLISLKAGGYGLNLTSADTVVHMDPWWNPAVEAQASDRAHRIGQTRPVTIYRLLMRDSVEERVRRLQQAKAGLFAQLSGDRAVDGLSREEVARLIL